MKEKNEPKITLTAAKSTSGVKLVKERVNCCFCKKEIRYVLTIFNNEEETFYRYMECNEASHIECYIDECVKRSLEKVKT